MPELIEVESYRRLAAEVAVGRVVAMVGAADAWYLKRGADAPALGAALVGRPISAARRRGKLLLLDIDEPPTVVLGLHFGMSGRLIVDGQTPAGRLLYAPAGDDARYDRFELGFEDGGALRLWDPRRLGGVDLDPVESDLGPDALEVTPAALASALAGGRGPLKAALLDQGRVAGIGNLLADEMLWRAGLAPGRPAGSLTTGEVRRLHRHARTTLRKLLARGGSHLGDLMPERRPGGRCPKDGTPLRRSTIGGRTTWWCAAHQC